MTDPSIAPRALIRPVSVEARGWGWRFASRLDWAVVDASFRIEPGERVLLLGASGAGKSTLLHALAGVLGGDDEGESRGELTIDGSPAARAGGRAGLVLQDPDSQAILARVGDDVAFGAENLGIPRDEIWRRVRESLDAVGLDVPLDRSTSALSGGQKQRLALAGVLAMRPGLVLLDEPTANLDPEGVREVRDAVERVAERTGATLIVVEHRIDVWLPLVDRVIVLGETGGGEMGGGETGGAEHDGAAVGVLADGAPADVLGALGPRLAVGGVWVPGIPPRHPAPPVLAPGPVVLEARDLTVGRVKG
ncbi:ABC transporter ATP-binding protein, partial [Microbacterium sp. C448]|uniref:ABC transporter ATP-binding protein n=1 Tax=Microbacterium sp. C448 TaxID=1177594 RepID=UPI001FB04AA8